MEDSSTLNNSRDTILVVPRGSVVKYRQSNIYVEQDGKIVNHFRRIRTMQVYNRIEGYLTYHRSAPSNRTLPGYGEC